MILRPPILIDIRKDRVLARTLGTNSTYDSHLQDEKTKAFYNSPQIIVEDVNISAAYLRSLISFFRPKDIGVLVKPIIIMNVPYEITQVETNSLKEAATLAGVRELIVLNESEMPSDSLFKPNHKIPGKVILGDDRFSSDEIIIFLFLLVLALMALAFLNSLKFND
ncbi:MAG TPA: hypothetical protein VNJ08_00565 [Bacteriovoracaceae bacterium]|nr:hypothetical protein [Bacteriovoracaceae bacterium]